LQEDREGMDLWDEGLTQCLAHTKHVIIVRYIYIYIYIYMITEMEIYGNAHA
jgi:hypothetical protein